MKSAFILCAFLFAGSSFASLTKTDSGVVSWTLKVDKKKEGVLVYSRNTVQVHGPTSATVEEVSMGTKIAFNSGIGGRSEYPMRFELTDERSIESVEVKIKEIIATELAKFEVTGREADVTFNNISCVESGLFKKELACSATFSHVQILDLK